MNFFDNIGVVDEKAPNDTGIQTEYYFSTSALLLENSRKGFENQTNIAEERSILDIL